MRANGRLGILVVVGLALVGVGLTGGQTALIAEPARAFGGAMPLWEPEWSPVLLLPGAVMPPPVDFPRALCVADVTGDGIPELLVGGDYIQVLSIADGKLSKRYLLVLVGVLKFVTPGGEVLKVQAMAAGDLDSDGLTDLVVATRLGKLWVFGNHGRRGFQPAPGSPYPLNVDHVWIHDHDGDGHLDVLVGGYAEVRLLRGDGQARLGEPQPVAGLAGRLWGGAAGVYANTPGFFVLTGQGLWFIPQGEVQAVQVLERGGRALAVGQFDGEGNLDVAIGDHDGVRIYPGRAAGLGAPTVLATDHTVAWLLAPDLNGDGWRDLVAGVFSPGGFSLFYNLAGEGFAGPYRHGVAVPAMGGLPPSTDLATAGDLDGDGMDDLAVAANLGHIAFFFARPQGRSLQAIPGSSLLGQADLNGDGYVDLLSSAPHGGVAALLNSGYGTFRLEPLVGPSKEQRLRDLSRMPYLARLADVTGDGVVDLVVFEFAKESFAVFEEGPPPRWKAARSEARVTAWDLTRKEAWWSAPLGEEVRPVLVLSDQTGDGVLDAVAAAGDKVIVLTHRPGEHPLRREIPWGGPVGPLVLLGDGTVAGLRVGLTVELLLLREGQLQETGTTLELAPLGLEVVDLDGDGNEDLVAIGWCAVEGALAMGLGVLWGEGSGRFRPEILPILDWPPMALPFPYRGLVAADLDGDGRLELAAMRLPDREGTPGAVVVLPWQGGKLGVPVLLPGCLGSELLALDVDGDGRAELATVALGISAYLCLTAWR